MLAVSPDAARFEERTFGVPATVLPNVIEYHRFASAEPFAEYDDDRKTILFLGRLVERKGCGVLLEAIRQLDRCHLPSFRVVVCGKGELKTELERFVKQNNLEDVVSFTGFVSEDDKPRYYASADISVFPSSAGESFGIVLLEAMASGRAAVLGGDNPGYRSVLAKQTDLLFAPKDSALLAQKITHLLQNDAERASYAAWGKEYTNGFDVNEVGKKLVKEYNQVLRIKRNLQ